LFLYGKRRQLRGVFNATEANEANEANEENDDSRLNLGILITSSDNLYSAEMSQSLF